MITAEFASELAASLYDRIQKSSSCRLLFLHVEDVMVEETVSPEKVWLDGQGVHIRNPLPLVSYTAPETGQSAVAFEVDGRLLFKQVGRIDPVEGDEVTWDFGEDGLVISFTA